MYSCNKKIFSVSSRLPTFVRLMYRYTRKLRNVRLTYTQSVGPSLQTVKFSFRLNQKSIHEDAYGSVISGLG